MMENKSAIKVMLSLVGLVKKYILPMIISIVLGSVGFLCAISIPVLGTLASLSILGYDFAFSFNQLCLLIVVLALLRGPLHYIEQACNHYLAFKILAEIRDKVFKTLRRLAPAKLEGKERGKLISLITSDVELLEVFYAHTISPAAIAVIVSLIIIYILSTMHFYLALIALTAFISVGIILPKYFIKKGKKIGEMSREEFSNMNTIFIDSIRGLSEIIQFNYYKKRIKAVDKKTKELLSHNKNQAINIAKNQGVVSVLISGFTLLMLFTSTSLYKINIIEFYEVLMSTVIIASSFGPVIAISSLGSSLNNTIASGNRILDLLEEKSQVEEISDKNDVDFEGVVMKDVRFSYVNQTLLKDVNLNVDKGNIIGILGPSGSGKSTILRLLMRFWDIDNGSIAFSNNEINTINTKSLRDNESFMTQETQIFHDSIKNNLLLAKIDATNEEIIEACKKASIHEFIKYLPNGYDTVIEENGDTISGGEKQRIGLARAFLHNSPLILLDEPTSNIDSLNEAIILSSLLKDKEEGRTIILVSHKLSTLSICDKIYYIQNGSIVDYEKRSNNCSTIH